MQDEKALVAELRRQNRLLKAGLGVGGAALAVLLLGAAAPGGGDARFAEIEVERINVRGADGKLEMVIANGERLPPPVTDGKVTHRNGGPTPGIIFYNDVGDENGGLIFDGKLDEKGQPTGGVHFSMDRFGGDQQLALVHEESDGTMESGLKIKDSGLGRDYLPLMAAYREAAEGPAKQALLQKLKDVGGRETDRLFVGKTRDKSSAVILADARGRARIRMLVAPEGHAMLQFLDEAGKVVQQLPQAGGAAHK